MKPSLKPGLKHRFAYRVPKSKTVPALYPEAPQLRVMPEVFATGFMVGLMEWTCVQLLEPHLDAGEGSLGVHIDVAHKAATPVDFTVTVAAGVVTTGDLAGLADTAVLLLLLVFAVVNLAVLVLRRDPVEHEHFRAPTWAPVLGAVACLVLASPLTGRDLTTYVRAGLLLGIGVLLWGVNRLAIRRWSSVPPG